MFWNIFRFDTVDAGAFIYSNQYLQISSTLMSRYIYGLEEHRKPFLKSIDWDQFSFWNADQWPSSKVYIIEIFSKVSQKFDLVYFQSTNLYGSHPMFINMNPETATGFGFFWLNSNAMGKYHFIFSQFFITNKIMPNFLLFTNLQRSFFNPLLPLLYDLLEAFLTSSSSPDLIQGKLSVNTTKSSENRFCPHIGVWDIINANSGTTLSIVLRKSCVKLKRLESPLMFNGTTSII